MFSMAEQETCPVIGGGNEYRVLVVPKLELEMHEWEKTSPTFGHEQHIFMS